jgi:hypothetical protein
MGEIVLDDREFVLHSGEQYMNAAAARAEEKRMSVQEQSSILETVEVLARDFERQPLSPEERARVFNLVGKALRALGLSTEKSLPKVYEAIASVASDDASRSGFSESMREIMRRSFERDIERLEASR